MPRLLVRVASAWLLAALACPMPAAFAAKRPATPAGAAVQDSVTPTPAGAPAALAAPAPAPLLLDPLDLGIGTAMIYRRVPNATDIAALAYYDNVNIQHLVLALPEWPEDYSEIEPLAKVILPDGVDVIVVLPGYPPSRSQAALWNMMRQRLRIVMSVDGPPVDRGLILEMNAMRGLERVIATMEHPSRSGFERLQRPLSFRVLVP